MGFRVWPAITKLVTLSSDRDRPDAVRVWVQRLIVDSEILREKHLYPGNSYDLELALAIPEAWSPPGNDWVGDALRARAWNNEATIRERGTAAMGLWQRAISQNRPDLESTEDDLRKLITEFRENPIGLPTTAAGFRWLAATLEHVIDNRIAVCNDWPDVDEPWFGRVQAAADRLDRFGIPDHLRDRHQEPVPAHDLAERGRVPPAGDRNGGHRRHESAGHPGPDVAAQRRDRRGMASYPRPGRSWFHAEIRCCGSERISQMSACRHARTWSNDQGADEITDRRDACLAICGG